ncbi:hypothetical protein ACFYW8_26930 [Streptomyces sp. NPDC002742]|uniref:hypothetical protein n=1 Tax=Streptomyces sp. NPDC002742 TaxID=3364663 RepID=UPI0036BAF6BA
MGMHEGRVDVPRRRVLATWACTAATAPTRNTAWATGASATTTTSAVVHPPLSWPLDDASVIAYSSGVACS